jgi:hypothetical protein
MLASGRKSEGNEGAEKRIPSLPLGMRRGREDRGKHVDNNGLHVDKTDAKEPRVVFTIFLLEVSKRNC